ncbi:MAG: hypothetical protein JSW40_09745 [Candidatus Omnitrophota bacterium]|nr:MAG: hypothetical protein JSW40_09745 [Candidatus Omnitrophota bacterium]
MLLKDILKTKTVAVWGLGYLGYTTMLKLQQSGFRILAYDFNMDQMRLFSRGQYPNRDQIASWSQIGYPPELDLAKIKLAKSPKDMFLDTPLHIIAIPESFKARQNVAYALAKLFSRNIKKRRLAPLVILESAFLPGHLERCFVAPLKKARLHCSRDYYLGVLLRTDWSIEAFVSRRDKMPIAGHCPKSLKAIRELCEYLKIPMAELGSIREAELYVNSISTIQAMVNDFVRQLTLGFSSVNMRRVSKALFENITFDECRLNMGTGGTKMTFAIDYLLKGSDNPKNLTLLREFQNINISSVLNYAEHIVRQSYKSVAILGVTYKGNQKDLTLSPSITLAEYLLSHSTKVLLNDPLFTYKELRALAGGAKIATFPEEVFSADVVVVVSDHNAYKYLSQRTLNAIKKKKTKLVIDNYGIWSHLSFGNKIKYHQVGDGSLIL